MEHTKQLQDEIQSLINKKYKMELAIEGYERLLDQVTVALKVNVQAGVEPIKALSLRIEELMSFEEKYLNLAKDQPETISTLQD